MVGYEGNIELADDITSPDTERFEDARNFSPLADTEYARRARAINRLRDLGVDRLELEGIDARNLTLPCPRLFL
jgi:phosphoribosylaminoimidazole-succinocarboxamide synthase